MASEGIPINKDMVAWARKRAGLTIEDAAEKFPHIAAWETGDALPTYPQLERLADELKLPIAAFFFPEPPTLPPIRESFRTLPDTEFEQIPRQVRFLLRKAKALQLNLAELTQGRNPSRRLITRELRFPSRAWPRRCGNTSVSILPIDTSGRTTKPRSKHGAVHCMQLACSCLRMRFVWSTRCAAM
jgi:transcriptional regulator with XRE-family HTH domain